MWQVDTEDGRRYVKVGRGAERTAVLDEAIRLRWARARLPVPTPAVLATDEDADGRVWLVTAGLEGVPAHDRGWGAHALEPMIEGVAAGLRRLHDTDPAGCPFTLGVDDLLASAERRVAAGGVDPTSMSSPVYQRRTAAELLAHLRATRPDEPPDDTVVAHGDAVLPNLLLQPPGGMLVGVVDVGRLGVSDRYRDLALAARSIAQNVGPEHVWRFLDAYGIPHPDPLRIEWYALVDDMW